MDREVCFNSELPIISAPNLQFGDKLMSLICSHGSNSRVSAVTIQSS